MRFLFLQARRASRTGWHRITMPAPPPKGESSMWRKLPGAYSRISMISTSRTPFLTARAMTGACRKLPKRSGMIVSTEIVMSVFLLLFKPARISACPAQKEIPKRNSKKSNYRNQKGAGIRAVHRVCCRRQAGSPCRNRGLRASVHTFHRRNPVWSFLQCGIRRFRRFLLRCI